MTTLTLRQSRVPLPLVVGVSVVAWLIAWFAESPLADWISYELLGLDRTSHLGGAVDFFLADVPKVLLLLLGIVTLVTLIRGFFPPERVRDALAGRGEVAGTVGAAAFGIVTPFCSCSAVPLFIGFVRVGVPLGVTFSYLVAAPMINEVALVLLWAMFGWRIALLYAGTGVLLASLSGWVMGLVGMESSIEPWVALERGESTAQAERRITLKDRLDVAFRGTLETVGKVWPYALAGIGVGAFLHGYIPEGFLAGFLGKQAWWSVPLAVLVGVPLYASTAVVLPIVQTLLAKGAALGTVLAFMMAVTGLSFPETILLRRVLQPRLILVFLGVVTLGILCVGFLFNALV